MRVASVRIEDQGFTHGIGQQPIPVHAVSPGSKLHEQTGCELYEHVQPLSPQLASQVLPFSSQARVVHETPPPEDPVAMPPQKLS